MFSRAITLSYNFSRKMSHKVDSTRMEQMITPELRKLVDLFTKNNFEIKIAGGAVRDLLSGTKIPDDIDLATTATPTEMKEMFTKESIRMINDQGEKHGTITARIDDNVNFEVTTLRIDKVTDGRRAEVEFTKDWRIDAERRDLTINSMFLEMDGTIVDFFDGHKDLQQNRVMFVGSAEKRIQEDYLRIMRYFRFYGRISKDENSHDKATLDAIRINGEGLSRVSGERIWMEWRKILAGPMGGPMTVKMIDLELGPYIGLPEVPNVEAFQNFWEQKGQKVHHITLLSQLLKTQEEMTTLNLRLKMSAYERDLGYFLIQYRDSIFTIKDWQKILIFSKNKSFHVKEWIIQAMICANTNFEEVEAFKNWEIPRFPVNGKELKEAGVPSGKFLGQCIEKLKLAWIDSDFKMDKEHLLKVELPKIADDLAK